MAHNINILLHVPHMHIQQKHIYHTHSVQIIHIDGIHTTYTTISYLHTAHTPHKSQVTQSICHTHDLLHKHTLKEHIHYIYTTHYTMSTTHTCMHAYIQTHVHTHECTPIHTNTCAHTHTLHTVCSLSPLMGIPEGGGGIRPDMTPIFPNQSQRGLLMGSLRTATVLFEAVDQQQWRDHIWGGSSIR